MRSKKASIELSYSWIFAIVAGVIIVFLAIYVSSRLMNLGQNQVSAKTGEEIGILLNPLETEFEAAQATTISISVDTRINNICSEYGVFGSQQINVDQKSFNKWKDTDINVDFENKYIFSLEQIEGKKFYIFSKPFKAPFKVADLFYFIPTTQRYCFKDAPESINQEIKLLGNNQTYIVTENCTNKDIFVCFGQGDCHMRVVILDDNIGYVSKDGEQMYFTFNSQDPNSLMYAAIFSDPSVYECQIKRLMARLSELSLLYASKEDLLETKGCDSSLGENLLSLRDLTKNINSSSQLEVVGNYAEILKSTNNGRNCKLW